MNMQPESFVPRRNPKQVTPDYEDAGLFQRPLVQVDVDLTPDMYRNDRRDLIVRCPAGNGRLFEVVFAGRRCVAAATVLTRLEAVKRQQIADAKARDAPVPPLAVMTFPITVEGVWRRRFARDRGGWETCFHQLVASRWTMIDARQQKVTFGVEPAVRVSRLVMVPP